METLAKLKIHDPAKAAVLDHIFEIINGEMKHPETGACVWDDANRTLELIQTRIAETVYNCVGMSSDDLKHHYETEYWRELEHMTIADYAPDAKHLHQFEDIETRYYQELERVVLESKAYEVVKEITEQLTSFYWYLDNLEREFWGDSDYKKKVFDKIINEPEAFNLAVECPHGWQSHTDEKEEGDLYLYRWINGQVEGANAISLSLFGGAIWATLTIDPKDGRHFLWEMRQ